jgi:hypothetical protein
MSDEPIYQITLTLEELRVISSALELLSRVGMAQLECVAEHTPVAYERGQGNLFRELRDTLIDISNLATNSEYPKGCYPGILNEYVPAKSRLAYQLYKLFRHRMAWDKNPEGGWTVDFDSPDLLKVHPCTATIVNLSKK